MELTRRNWWPGARGRLLLSPADAIFLLLATFEGGVFVVVDAAPSPSSISSTMGNLAYRVFVPSTKHDVHVSAQLPPHSLDAGSPEASGLLRFELRYGPNQNYNWQFAADKVSLDDGRTLRATFNNIDFGDRDTAPIGKAVKALIGLTVRDYHFLQAFRAYPEDPDFQGAWLQWEYQGVRRTARLDWVWHRSAMTEYEGGSVRVHLGSVRLGNFV